MEKRFAGKKLTSFVQDNEGKWSQSPELKKVLGIMQENTDKQIDIEMYPSPMLVAPDTPAWGSKGGVYNPKTGRAYVDPLSHPTVGAHEAAHQAFMTPHATKDSFSKQYQERMQKQLNNPANFTPEMIDKGATMRMEYEIRDKHRLIEEANANGVATAAMNKAGLPVDDSGWGNMYAYPEAHSFGQALSQSAPVYKQGANKPGISTLTPDEAAEFGAMQRSAPTAVRRQFDIGYGMIK